MPDARRRIPVVLVAIVALVAGGAGAGGTYLAMRHRSAKPAVLAEKLCGSPPASCATPTPTITPTEVPSAPAEVPTPTPTPSAPAVPPPTPTPTPAPIVPRPATKPACLDSTDPACGRFFWAPTPARDQALSIRVAWGPVPATVGQPVSFTVTVDDGDAAIEDVPRYSFGDAGTASDLSCPPSHRYGPWTTPPQRHGHVEFTVTHTYASAGRYTARFVAHSGHCGDTPYGDAISIDVPITVQTEAEMGSSPSPSPEPSETPTPAPVPQTG